MAPTSWAARLGARARASIDDGSGQSHRRCQARAAAPAAEADLGTLLASATPDNGEKVFGKCKACHTIEQGGKKVGPNLYNVVGGPKAHIEGFAYSPTLAGIHSQTWTYEDLYTFLASPKEYIAGTKMTFAGLSDGKDRAAVIRYLAANIPNPPPLPEPAPKTAAAETPQPAASGKAATQAAAATAAPDTGAAGDIKDRLASADPAAGEKVFGKCKACHNVEKGGPNQVGPTCGTSSAGPSPHHDGFSYSAALAAKKGDKWSYEELEHLSHLAQRPGRRAPR